MSAVGIVKSETMADEEKLRCDIDTLRESIRSDLANLAAKHLTADKRKALREHLELCNSTLKDLLERLDMLSKSSN